MSKPSVGANAQPQALAVELRVLAGQLKRRLREQTNLGGISWSQVDVLRRLDLEGPATVSALARAEGMRPQSMGAIIAALTKAGLVQGEPHPSDGRQTLLSVTETFHSWLKLSRAAREDWLSHTIQARLDMAEQQQLADAIVLLKRLLEP
jgi:DNA-binding MarR family transcriptional regulator